MKLLHKILAAAAGILALSSCMDEAIAPITGKYEKPVVYEMNTLVSQSVEKGEKTRTFTVEVTNNEASLNMKFVGSEYYLADAGYTAAPADAAKRGNYIVGNGGSTFTLGGSAIPVESGTLIVSQADGNYTFTGMLWLADETVVEIKSAVALVYEPDPEPVILSSVLSATSNLANGISSVTMQLAQEGVYSEFDMTTFLTTWHGEGYYLSIDLYSADGYLHEGTYTANSEGGVIGEGQFGIGYDTTVDWGWGPMEMKDWGTCWWTVGDGIATAEKILEGTVTVTKKGSKWVIELISGEGKEMLWTKFEGAVEALTPTTPEPGGDDTDYEELSVLLSATSNLGYGTNSFTINMATEGVSSSFDATTYQTTYSGTGNYLALDIYTADGKLYTGTYNANTVGGTIAEGQFGIGYDTEMWGMTMENWGTCWWTVEDGATSAEKVLDGTVEVAVEGDNLVIKLKSSITNAKFTYPVADFKDGTGTAIEVVNLGGNAEPEIEYEELTDFLTITSYIDWGQNLVGVELATEGVSYTTDWDTWQTTYNGEGHYLKLELYSTDGTIAAGTYKACATGGSVGEGEFGIGYDGQWGASGTTWYAVSEGTATGTYIIDGTVTVEIDGDTYTIILESSVVNAKYVGTLTL